MKINSYNLGGHMVTIKVTIKEIELIRERVLSRFAFKKEPLIVLIIKEYSSWLNRNGVIFDLQIEEDTEYGSDE